jgi:predicted ATPase
MRSYDIAEQSTGPVFFDRGAVQRGRYLRLLGSDGTKTFTFSAPAVQLQLLVNGYVITPR